MSSLAPRQRAPKGRSCSPTTASPATASAAESISRVACSSSARLRPTGCRAIRSSRRASRTIAPAGPRTCSFAAAARGPNNRSCVPSPRQLNWYATFGYEIVVSATRVVIGAPYQVDEWEPGYVIDYRWSGGALVAGRAMVYDASHGATLGAVQRYVVRWCAQCAAVLGRRSGVQPGAVASPQLSGNCRSSGHRSARRAVSLTHFH